MMKPVLGNQSPKMKNARPNRIVDGLNYRSALVNRKSSTPADNQQSLFKPSNQVKQIAEKSDSQSFSLSQIPQVKPNIPKRQLTKKETSKDKLQTPVEL